LNLLKYRWLNIGILFTVLIAAIVSWAVLGLNLGVDFTGVRISGSLSTGP